MFNKKYFNVLLFVLALIPGSGFAQQRNPITLEDIWQRGTFQESTVRGVNWMANGQFYSSQVADRARGVSHVIRYNITTGAVTDTIANGTRLIAQGENRPINFDSYSFGPGERSMLFATNTEPIYRRSYKADYYVYDLGSNQLRRLSAGGPQSYATFSPDGTKIAFTRDNNLFYTDLATMQEVQVTTTGEFNRIIHGSTDWVYEEELSFAQAFFWSPDSRKIAFYTFDESHVKEYNMQLWKGLYPTDYRFKYPKAGERNSIVTLSVFNLQNASTVPVEVGPEQDQYIARVNWTHNPEVLAFRRLNRLQNKLELLHADAATGKSMVILTETAPNYIDIEESDLTYLANGRQFIYTSELKGYKHLFLYDINGRMIRQITQGNWEVDKFLGIDEKSGTLYFTSTEVSPTDRQLYSININGRNKRTLTPERGTYAINMSPDFRYFLSYHTTANTPTVVSLHDGRTGAVRRVLEDNQALRQKLAQYQIKPLEFFQFNTSEGVSLNGWMIKPAQMDPQKKYPVLMFVYGGPGSQQVLNRWGGANYLWYQMLADKGYVIACVDNRGTGGRGNDFKKVTYANLGHYEVIDQIEAGKHLGSLPFIDNNRIGIWGWSYGGYMTSLALTLGADVFKTGIAVAPVTNWRFYDTIYTERYLKTPQQNPEGYDNNSPVTHAAKLKGNYFLIHGTGDDNVHFQNAVAMQDALIKNNKQYESFYYPDRNHGIYGGNTRLHLYQMMTDFLLRKL